MNSHIMKYFFVHVRRIFNIELYILSHRITETDLQNIILLSSKRQCKGYKVILVMYFLMTSFQSFFTIDVSVPYFISCKI